MLYKAFRLLFHQCCNKIETRSNPMKHFAVFFIPLGLILNSRFFVRIIEYCFILQIISSNTNCYVMLKENKCCDHINPQKLITLSFPRFNLTFATKQILIMKTNVLFVRPRVIFLYARGITLFVSNFKRVQLQFFN